MQNLLPVFRQPRLTGRTFRNDEQKAYFSVCCICGLICFSVGRPIELSWGEIDGGIFGFVIFGPIRMASEQLWECLWELRESW